MIVCGRAGRRPMRKPVRGMLQGCWAMAWCMPGACRKAVHPLRAPRCVATLRARCRGACAAGRAEWQGLTRVRPRLRAATVQEVLRYRRNFGFAVRLQRPPVTERAPLGTFCALLARLRAKLGRIQSARCAVSQPARSILLAPLPRSAHWARHIGTRCRLPTKEPTEAARRLPRGSRRNGLWQCAADTRGAEPLSHFSAISSASPSGRLVSA
jgi:hypothetical protein